MGEERGRVGRGRAPASAGGGRPGGGGGGVFRGRPAPAGGFITGPASLQASPVRPVCEGQPTGLAAFMKCGCAKAGTRKQTTGSASPGSGHDQYHELMNLPAFLDLLPAPGRRTLDLGCGEGRVSRALAPAGHTMVATDSSPVWRPAATLPPAPAALVSDATRLPFMTARLTWLWPTCACTTSTHAGRHPRGCPHPAARRPPGRGDPAPGQHRRRSPARNQALRR